MPDGELVRLREQIVKLQTEVQQHNKTLNNISKTLTDPKTGMCARIIRIETTLSNLKWTIGIGTPILLVLVELALKGLKVL